MKFTATVASVFVLMLAQLSFSQTLPSKIRGYKVYDTKVVVLNADDAATAQNKDANVAVRLLKPKVTGLGLTGVTVEVLAEMTPLDRSGRVDLMTFKDFRINGIPIEVEEYSEPFSFKKGEKITFSKPARISINTANLAKGAYKELVTSKEDWSVTGTVFVFGKFKTFGISYKRVVPVKIDLKIKNLLQ